MFRPEQARSAPFLPPILPCVTLPHKKESPDCSEDSKEAATYSPTCYCSTIGVNGLNFPFRNRKGELRCYNHLNLYCYTYNIIQTQRYL